MVCVSVRGAGAQEPIALTGGAGCLTNRVESDRKSTRRLTQNVSQTNVNHARMRFANSIEDNEGRGSD
jgi:hypothetical protein